MSNGPNQTAFRAGAFVSEDAVRNALDPGRRGRSTHGAPAARRTQLRRWSVADLIARAVPALRSPKPLTDGRACPCPR